MSDLSAHLDRTGVCASILCALHCLTAPVLTLVAPALRGLWDHPVSHISIAALVVPLAVVALRRGFKAHGRRWIPTVGATGMGLVVLGAALPYLAAAAPTASTVACDACDQCCPSLVTDNTTGASRLNVPPASLVTLLGGASMIVAHVANLRSCACCRRG
ncbi:MAG: MerC domain-containing protein [Planctomycetota bacterium]